MKIFLTFLLLQIALIFPTMNYAVDDYSSSINAFKKAKETRPFFKNSYGYALFPKIGKGGFGVGGAYGKGQVYKGGKVAGITGMSQVTIGLQAGGQAYSQIIFFQDKRAYKEFTTGNFEFGAQAAAVAVTAGVSASTNTTGKSAGKSIGGKSAGDQVKGGYRKGMATFTYSKGGFMYEATLGGQKYSFKPLAGKK